MAGKLETLTQQELRELPTLFDTELIERYRLIRQPIKLLCELCDGDDLSPTIPVYEGDHMFRLDCYRCGTILLEGVYPESLWAELVDWSNDEPQMEND